MEKTPNNQRPEEQDLPFDTRSDKEVRDSIRLKNRQNLDEREKELLAKDIEESRENDQPRYNH